MTALPFSVPAAQSFDSDERYTPRWVFDGLGLTFDLDPASPVNGGDFVPAARRYTIADDGLTQPWHGLVWLNPPFSNATPWARRFIAHGRGVFLGPIANSAWWVEMASRADLLWLCRDFAFVHPTHAGRRSSMPLAFAAYGDEAAAGLSALSALWSTRRTPGGRGMKRHAWMDRGACRTLPDDLPPDLFFPEYEGGNHAEQQAKADQARRICWDCPVRVECRDYARTFKIQDGIWGGVWLDRGRKRKENGPTPINGTKGHLIVHLPDGVDVAVEGVRIDRQEEEAS